MLIRLLLAACFCLSPAALAPAADDANSAPAGRVQGLAKEISDLLRLKVAGKALCVDREHWTAAVKGDAEKKDGNDTEPAPAPAVGKRLARMRIVGGAIALGGAMGGEGGDPAQVLFHRLQAASGCMNLSTSNNGAATQMSASGNGMLLAMSQSGESFSLSITEEGDAGQYVRLSEPGKGELQITIVHLSRPAMLTLKQTADGRISIVHLRGDKVTRLRGDSYVDLFGKEGAYVEKELLPLLRQMGIVLGEHRFSPAVTKAVLSLLADPLAPERAKQFDAQIADLDAPTFARREAATKALTEDLVHCYGQVAAAVKTAAAGSEKRERLERILATNPDLRKVCEIVHEGKMLQDAAYLVALIDRVEAKDRAAVAAALRKLTGKDFGPDAAAWQKWLDSEPKK